jgi:DNA-binding MarR family transcriptional regulator
MDGEEMMAGRPGVARREASTSRIVQLRQQEAEIAARLDPLLADRGLLPEHWRIIAVIDDHPGVGMRSVSDSAVVPAASLTRHVDRLVELGMVLRHIDQNDRRRTVVALSRQGTQLAELLRGAEVDATQTAAPAEGSSA